jgi:hypothetical protein
MLMHQCLSGLRADVRRFIMAQSPKTYEDIWKLALKEEECAALENSAVNINLANISNRSSNLETELNEIKCMFQNFVLDSEKKFTELTSEMQKLQQHRTEPSRNWGFGGENMRVGTQHFNREIICYNCGKKGHISRNCWSRTNRNSQENTENLNSYGDKVGPRH